MKTPALDAWRDELRKGERTKYQFDALWKAACAESCALEFANIPELARACRDDARKIIRDALKQQQRGVVA